MERALRSTKKLLGGFAMLLCAILSAIASIALVSLPRDASAESGTAAKSPHQQYRVVVLPVDGGADSFISGYLLYAALTSRGTMAVSADTATPGVFNSYTWTRGRSTQLQPLPPIPDWAGDNTYINWINLWGLSAGYATRTNSGTGQSVDNAVIWAPDGGIINLIPRTDTQSHAVWVNNLGQVSGWFSSTTPVANPACAFGFAANFTQTEAFIWEWGTVRRLGTLGGTQSYGEFINNLGQVSGHSETSKIPNGVTGCPPYDPFIWQDGRMTDINPGNFGGAEGGTNFLNDRGEAVGFGTMAGEVDVVPFSWQKGKLTNLNDIGTLGAGFGSAFNVSEQGHVVGVNLTPAGEEHAVLWRNETFTDLLTLSGDDCSQPFRINSHDQIVGVSYSCETFVEHAFLWEHGEMVDLDTLIPDGLGLTLEYAQWITDDGVIAAQATLTSGPNSGDSRAVMLIPVGDCDPAVQAARASRLASATPQAGNASGAATKKATLFISADGRVNPLLRKPVSPALLKKELQALN